MAPKSGHDLPGVMFLAISAASCRRGIGNVWSAADRTGGPHAPGQPPLYILFFSGKQEKGGAEIRAGWPRAAQLFEKRQRAKVR